MIVDRYPVVREFGPGSTTCASSGGHGTGCAVCTAAAILLRWGAPIPTLPDGRTLDAESLGASMGGRHRAADRTSRHGLSLVQGQRCSGGYWCAYCIYLELKARHVPVAYGKLNESQLLMHLAAGHPIAVPGDYWQVPVVSRASVDAHTPARGRVQSSLSARPFGHMVTLWGLAEGNLTTYVVSDPDFGSRSAADVPPHSLWPLGVVIDFWRGLGSLPVCYAVTAPPLIGPVPVPKPAGPHYAYGGRPTSRGSYLVTMGARVRSSPYVRSSNIVVTTSRAAGTSFAAAQATYAGTNVGGSTLWLGNRAGDRWVHASLAKLVGHTTGHEVIR
jgi:hypothetical protein